MKPITLSLLALVALTGGFSATGAQAPTPPPAPAEAPVSADTLAQWLGPVALYPDPLLAQVLTGATHPADLVLAEHYLGTGGDPSQLDSQPWDPSVKALARYPEVVQLLNQYLGWTAELGRAVLQQGPQVLEGVQQLRAQALALGNLQCTPQVNVLTDDGAIELVPTEPDSLYVPDYEPDIVFAYHPLENPAISFGAALPMGPWMNRDFDWHQGQLLGWDHLYPRPADWWSSRITVLPAIVGPSRQSQPVNRAANPRTRTAHFVMWQTPHVRVVTAQGVASGNWGSVAHLEPQPPPPPACVGPGAPSLIVMPFHSPFAQVVAPLPVPDLPVYAPAIPVGIDDFSTLGYNRGARHGGGGPHRGGSSAHHGHEGHGSGGHSGNHSGGATHSHSPSPGHSGSHSGRR